MNRLYTVYSLKTSNGKRYIGTTSMNVKERWNNGNGYRFNKELWEQIEKFGWDSVEKTIYAENLTKEEASRLEKSLIRQFDSANPVYGYNNELGGITNEKLVSVRTRSKHSESVSGEKNHNYGKHFSEEHKRKIAKSNRGQKRSLETRIRVGKAKEKPVVQYTLQGLFLNQWESAKKAALATGAQAGHISKVCKSQRKTAGGFVWRFAID